MKVSLHSLHKQFGLLRVLHEVSADFRPGAVTALLGANGAGKTTLLRCLSGLSSGDSGSVQLDGEVLNPGRLDLRRRLLFLPDFPPCMPGNSILEHVALHLNLWEVTRPGVEDQVAQWIDELHLTAFAEKSVGSLSRGQRYKASLLALLAVDPELWLLDEPFASGMDAGGLAIFRREARAAAERGRTVIYSTQIVELAAGFSDCIGIAGGGRLRLFDTAADFEREPAKIEQQVMAV
jgi:ABC-type multidrug transport system ATPase subunit